MNKKLIKFTLPSLISPESPPDFVRSGQPGGSGTSILIAEDDPVSYELITTHLTKWGYNVVATRDGAEAMAILRGKDAPLLAILDWVMPGLDGAEICRRVRETKKMVYIILLTARGGKENVIEGLRAGADDYLIKPFDKDELRARILVGLRVMELQDALVRRVEELEAAANEIKSLKLQIPL